MLRIFVQLLSDMTCWHWLIIICVFQTSIASATNIDTLLANKEGIDGIVVPPEVLQDKVFFIFNNLSQSNMDQKASTDINLWVVCCCILWLWLLLLLLTYIMVSQFCQRLKDILFVWGFYSVASVKNFLFEKALLECLIRLTCERENFVASVKDIWKYYACIHMCYIFCLYICVIISYRFMPHNYGNTWISTEWFHFVYFIQL